MRPLFVIRPPCACTVRAARERATTRRGMLPLPGFFFQQRRGWGVYSLPLSAHTGEAWVTA